MKTGDPDSREMPVSGIVPNIEPSTEPLSESGNKNVIIDPEEEDTNHVNDQDGKCGKKCDRKKSSNCSFSSKILLCGSESKRKEIVDENNPQSASSDPGQNTSKGRKSCRKGSKKNNSRPESIPLSIIEQAPVEDPSSQTSGQANVPSDQSVASVSASGVGGVNNKNNKSCCFCWCCCCSCSW